MSLTPEERAAVGADEEAEEKPKAPTRIDRSTFRAMAEADLAKIEQSIADAEAIGAMLPLDAAVNRLLIAVLRDPESKSSERTKAIETLGKLQGLFVIKVKDLTANPNKMSDFELLEKFAKLTGITVARGVPQPPANATIVLQMRPALPPPSTGHDVAAAG